MLQNQHRKQQSKQKTGYVPVLSIRHIITHFLACPVPNQAMLSCVVVVVMIFYFYLPLALANNRPNCE